VAQLPGGRRRAGLEAAFEALLSQNLEQPVLGFDSAAAEQAAKLAARQRRSGHPVDVRDKLIGGICDAGQSTLATRSLEA
jgi:predicted nucleic acid-binding protein